MTDLLSGLYYPFSRSINQRSMKQILLVFQSITFLDPVDEASWRAHLFKDMERGDPRFKKYRDMDEVLPTLVSEGAIKRADPKQLAVVDSPATAASALSDLMDEDWRQVASNPSAFGVSSGFVSDEGKPLWKIFKPKIPSAFIDSVQSSPDLRRHILRTGGEDAAWTMSYEAGSAVATNVHLAAAEVLGLAPVTDSAMHHELLLRKLVRNSSRSGAQGRPRSLSTDVVRQLTQMTAISMIDEILPTEKLDQLNFDDILKFREDTQQLRRQAVVEISHRLEVLSRVPDVDELMAASKEVEANLRRELRSYRTDLAGTRDRLWPQLAGSMASALAPGSVAAVAMNYIGGPGHALAASITAAALTILKVGLDARAEQRKAQNSTAPAVAYLSSLAELS
jgi:hypothetical protein